MASSNVNFKAGDDWRKAKELEEARKAGLAPAERDEDGKEINPHIPQYMASAPWYLNNNQPSLKHQRNWNAKDAVKKVWYDRGAKTFQADKYRKGACSNCGALTHKLKDCTERPRKKGAKFSGIHIAADEKIQEIHLDFEGKRDRWNGYDASDYSRVIARHDKMEALKDERQKAKELEKKFQKQEGGEDDNENGNNNDAAEGGSDSEDEGGDEEKVTEAEEAGFGKVEKRVRTAGGGASGTVRNLRIREDTAKYLLNLDLSSAHYDPKTRSMREDPTPMIPASDKLYAGDNYVRYSGDTQNFNQLSRHAWEAFDKGQDIHMQAAPSQAEMLKASFHAKKANLKQKSSASIIAKYGNAASEDKPDSALLLGQTEGYVEYDRAGRLVKGEEAPVARSKYEEDVYINNHTAVWGSWYHQGVWGYACCRSNVKQSYCTGAAGLAAAEASASLMQNNMTAKAEHAEAEKAAKESKLAEAPKQISWGTDVEEVDLDPEKLKEALAKARAEEKEEVERDERKRKYNSNASVEVTEEEMEAYRMTKRRADDPLAEMMANGVGGTDGYDMV
mmetsp:Transcript_18797/g.22533  ORF Transcript_18797/g.22533 Transcript_18797/m.22533 type:complete len:562 (-) Transcript_18797:439-2124(-)|eukprot:CAMPEP_0197859676 /NCGR_PEP_ID=MMETSP1438-20131217/34457_1 /TAXON_ID=1461541 /ORGANISM="Pterosperma sp., Strain CCMP1384" /LENGTH=561 /DNA_ID=CAMNT_0043476267 /DNA_START=147 /DNA_END=1832 /DNA_ORIENTATION=+